METRVCKYWSNDDFKRWFGVSRSTAWRARKSGHLHLGYHKKELKLGQLSIPVSVLIRDAKVGALKAVRTYLNGVDRFNLDDLIQEAVTRLLELAGHQNFNRQGWRVMVARNAASTFIRTHIKKDIHLTFNQNTGGISHDCTQS